MANTATLARWQAVSGLVFASFALPHLLNVAVSVFGPGRYDHLQGVLRSFYQWPLAEASLLSAVAVHIVVGVWRWRLRRRTPGRRSAPLRTRLHRASAYFLLLAIVGHVVATRGIGWWFGAPMGFTGLSLSMALLPGWFYPYYAMLGACGLYHGARGVSLALRTLGVKPPSIPAVVGRGAMTAGVVLVVLGVLSFGGVLYEIDDPWESDYVRTMSEHFDLRRPEPPTP